MVFAHKYSVNETDCVLFMLLYKGDWFAQATFAHKRHVHTILYLQKCMISPGQQHFQMGDSFYIWVSQQQRQLKFNGRMLMVQKTEAIFH